MRNFEANSEETRLLMLKEAGFESFEELFSKIPCAAKTGELALPKALSELELQREIKSISKKNNTNYACFMGGGAYKRFIPAAVSEVSSRFEFKTAYTPYQAEISQGTLHAIYEFQSLMCEITGMDVANASHYDGGTALAEAAMMAVRITGRNRVLMSDATNPEYKRVTKTYLDAAGVMLEFAELKELETDMDKVKAAVEQGEYAVFIIQSPNFYGSIEELEALSEMCNASKTLLCIAIDPIASCVLRPASEFGADIAVLDIQQIGNSMSFGGASGGVIACLDKHKRALPGRIAGMTVDKDGNRAFVLTLQAREQHIRREKATSNICSNQALCAMNTATYLSLMGKKGMQQAAYMSAKNAHTLAEKLSAKGFKVLNKEFFNEFTLETENSEKFLEKLYANGILGGIKLDEKRVLVATTELNTEAEIEKYIIAAL